MDELLGMSELTKPPASAAASADGSVGGGVAGATVPDAAASSAPPPPPPSASAPTRPSLSSAPGSAARAAEAAAADAAAGKQRDGGEGQGEGDESDSEDESDSDESEESEEELVVTGKRVRTAPAVLNIGSTMGRDYTKPPPFPTGGVKAEGFDGGNRPAPTLSAGPGGPLPNAELLMGGVETTVSPSAAAAAAAANLRIELPSNYKVPPRDAAFVISPSTAARAAAAEQAAKDAGPKFAAGSVEALITKEMELEQRKQAIEMRLNELSCGLPPPTDSKSRAPVKGYEMAEIDAHHVSER